MKVISHKLTQKEATREVPVIHQTTSATFFDAMAIVRLYFDPDAGVIVAHGVKFVASKEQETELIHSHQCSSASHGQYQLLQAFLASVPM